MAEIWIEELWWKQVIKPEMDRLLTELEPYIQMARDLLGGNEPEDTGAQKEWILKHVYRPLLLYFIHVKYLHYIQMRTD